MNKTFNQTYINTDQFFFIGVQYKVNSIKSIKYLDRVFKQYNES